MVQQKKCEKHGSGVTSKGKPAQRGSSSTPLIPFGDFPCFRAVQLITSSLEWSYSPKSSRCRNRERFATRNLLSGRRSNRFHLDSNLSHRNDHDPMIQPPADSSVSRSKGEALDAVNCSRTSSRACPSHGSIRDAIHQPPQLRLPAGLDQHGSALGSRLSLRTAMRANAQAVLEISSSPNSDLGHSGTPSGSLHRGILLLGCW